MNMKIQIICLSFISVFLLLQPQAFAIDTVEESIDRSAGYYAKRTLVTPNPFFCQKKCMQDSRCKSWTMSRANTKGSRRAQCFFSDRTVPGIPDSCCVSGLVGAAQTAPQAPTAPAPAPSQVQPGAEGPSNVPAKTQGKLSDEECMKFAELAVREYYKAKEHKCNFSGPLWSNSVIEIHKKCKRSSRKIMENEAFKRHDMIAECIDRRPARENDGLDCERFADISVEIAQQAERSGCRPSDSRWSLDRMVHIRACRTSFADKDAARRELEARRHQLANFRCVHAKRNAPSPDQACVRFARIALNLARQARRYRCGFSGSSWSLSQRVHRAACRSFGAGQYSRILSKRRAQVKRCRRVRPRNQAGSSKSSSAFCVQYAIRTVVVTRKARSLNCPYRGRIWSVKKRKQRAWCKGKSRAQINAAIAQRARLLRKCQRDRDRRDYR